VGAAGDALRGPDRTAAVLETLRDGVPAGPELLDVGTVYRRVRGELARRREPTPRLLTNDQGGLAPLVRNRAANRPPEEAPGSPPPEAAGGRRARTTALALAGVLGVAAVGVAMALMNRGGDPGTNAPPGAASSSSDAARRTIAAGDIGVLASTRSGQCVEVLNGSPLDGLCLAGRDDLAVVQLPCDKAQTWRLRHRGTVRGGDGLDWDLWEVRNTGFDGKKCLDLPDGSMVPGTKLRLAGCDWSPVSQQWRTLVRKP
jgi:hypothetical protein